MSGPTLRPGDLRTVRISTLDDEGRGRADAHGVELCVRGGFPGDLVRAVVERVFPASGVAQARALTVLEEGPLHVPRSCPHAAPCAGCPLHGLEEHAAADLKIARIASALEDAGLVDASARIAALLPSRAPRQKVKLVVGAGPDAGRIGLYVPHTHVLHDAFRCPNHHAHIERALTALRPHLVPPVKAVIARAFVEGVGVVLVCGEPLVGDRFRAVSALVDGAPIASLAVRVDASGGNSLVSGEVERQVGPAALSPLDGGPPVSTDAFCQPDALLAEDMVAAAARFLTENGVRGGVYADLYAGSGAFTRGLLRAGAARVIAVERAPAGAAGLRLLPDVDAHEEAVEQSLPRLRAQPLAGIVLDPPKKGLGPVAAPLAALRAPRVALVACDPDAGARDARAFVDAGYALAEILPVDLFPGSPEVESVYLLTLS